MEYDKRCTKCSLSSGCKTTLLFGRGAHSSRTKLMIVQDYPTYFDNLRDMVASGDTGAKLNYFLDKVGIKFSEVFFTSAIKCTPKQASDVKGQHIEMCREYLLSEVMEHKPRLILTMGKTAHQMLTGKKSLADFAGHFIDFDFSYEVEAAGNTRLIKFETKLLPTFSLSSSLKKWEVSGDIIHHFGKAKAYLATGEIPPLLTPKVNTILTLTALNEFVEIAREQKYCASDLETTGFDFFRHKIINAGFAFNKNLTHILFLEQYKKAHSEKWTKQEISRGVEINKFTKQHHKSIHTAIKTVNSFDNLSFIFHNGKFDLKFLLFNGMPIKNFKWDTLIADSLIDENVTHSLNYCLERRDINFGPYDTELWKYVSKDVKKRRTYQFIPPPLMEQYLGFDCSGAFRLFEQQVKEIKREGMTEHLMKQKMPILKHIMESEYVGVKIDKKLLLDTSKIITKKFEELQLVLDKLTSIDAFNPNSPKQILTYMIENHYPFEKLKIKRNKTGYSTNETALLKFTKFKKYSALPQVILNFKKLSKIKGTYVDGKNGKGGFVKYLDLDNRIHANFNLHTARTSRHTCNSPSLQVWPRPVKGLPNSRNVILPTDNNWVLFEADFVALEQYIVAALSEDMNLISNLKTLPDIHAFNAVNLGHTLGTIDKSVSYEQFLECIGKGKISKDKLDPDILYKFTNLRTQAKMIGFGLNYGKMASSYAEEFKITIDKAQDMIDAYFSLYPQLKHWRDEKVKEALTKGFISLPSGRKRRFGMATDFLNSKFGENVWISKNLKEEIGRQAMNTPVQGGAHEVFEPAILRLMDSIKQQNIQARALMFIHDGVVGECHKSEVKRIGDIIQSVMPTILNKGKKSELLLKIDHDFYASCWYSEKVKYS